MRGHREVTGPKRELARRMRRHQTPSERLAWRLLRNRQLFALKFRRQHPLKGFIVDFYCAELSLVLELEGGIHEDPQRAAYDRQRAAILTGYGYKVVRLRNHDLTADALKRLLAGIVRSPLPAGERGQG